MKKLLIVIITVLFFSSNVQSEITADTYLKVREGNNEKEKKFVRDHIMGIATGVLWTNAYLYSKKMDEVFCSPDNMVLNTENYVNFLDREIEYRKKVGAYDGKDPIAMMILLHLVDVFPCKK